MNSIESQFVPYEIAVKLKDLGFDELCIAREYGGGFTMLPSGDPLRNSEIKEPWFCVLPLFQQAFDWFRVEHGLSSYVREMDSGRAYWKINLLNKKGSVKGYSGFENEYELSKIKCLKELIKIFKNEI